MRSGRHMGERWERINIGKGGEIQRWDREGKETNVREER